ncbi:MAG: YigZ family protein [Lachnospiraceae bacterium]|nr:YigZ family protein [Lachnospiraceae bacterium]
MDKYPMNKFRCIFEGGTGQIEEKKSRFICHVSAAGTEEEAVAFINEKKKEYWDARHNCSAFVIGRNAELTRCSDDGEPAGTAGRPMLEVLLNEEIRNVAVVVTRYFGGVLLGTGGLVRAYQAAVKAGLDNCCIIEKCEGTIASLTADYTIAGKLQYVFEKNRYTVLDSVYEESVTFTLIIPGDEWDRACSAVTEATAGRAGLVKERDCIYGIVNGEAIIF